MKNKLLQKLPVSFLLFFSVFMCAQEGTIKGVLKNNDGLPIPGVNVQVKNSKVGVATDFDGEYSINCRIGNILVFSSIGMKTREVLVTEAMFGDQVGTVVEMVPIKVIKTKAYKEAIESNKKERTLSLLSSRHTYNKRSFFEYNRIREIDIKDKQVKLTYFKPDIYFEIGYNVDNSFQFVKDNNLPELQNIYSQGGTSNGVLAFQGAETGNVFSYGPKLTNLEFDGSSYAYDSNGKLVALGNGNGNGNNARAYNNSLFKTSLKSSNHLFFNVSTNASFFGFDYVGKVEKDLFNIEKSNSNDLEFIYKRKQNSTNRIGWNTFVKYSAQVNEQPNSNGFLNNILLNNWITPITFNINEGVVFEDGTQRSFAPNSFNNSNWLFKNNNNSDEKTRFIASVQNKFDVSEDIKIDSKLNYSTSIHEQIFGVVKNTIGFEEGYVSNRNITKKNINGVLNFKYQKRNYGKEIKVISKTDYTHENLNYKLSEASGFDLFSFDDANVNNSNEQSIYRNKLRLLNRITYTFHDIDLDLGISNNSYISSLQNDKWILPTLQFKLDLNEFLNIYDFRELSVSSSTSFDVNDATLFYNNQSHNSLLISPAESLQYVATNDLFLNESLALEEKESYNLNIDAMFYLWDANFSFSATYFNTTIKNTVFPVLENGAFQLQNIAAIKNTGFELELSTRLGNNYGSNFYYKPIITFATNRSNVLKLTNDAGRVAIAGFNTTSKNLIVGESAGVIVGSAYVRDPNNRMVIGQDGFPLVAEELKIIGDPTPKFNLGFNNELNWKDLSLSFVVDVQKGGDVWNGTQNVLNYFGTSAQSALERNTTDYIFNGVNMQGEENTVPVDFYNAENDISENKFVRYGFEGVAEDAIVDGSYVNLKSVNLSYDIIDNNKENFVKDLTCSVYGYNLITWSKFNGASPYSSLYGNSNGVGLNFFNAPLVSEIGFKVNIKI